MTDLSTCHKEESSCLTMRCFPRGEPQPLTQQKPVMLHVAAARTQDGIEVSCGTNLAAIREEPLAEAMVPNSCDRLNSSGNTMLKIDLFLLPEHDAAEVDEDPPNSKKDTSDAQSSELRNLHEPWHSDTAFHRVEISGHTIWQMAHLQHI